MQLIVLKNVLLFKEKQELFNYIFKRDIISDNKISDISQELINGLQLLEYRGYDSAGIGLLQYNTNPNNTNNVPNNTNTNFSLYIIY